MDNAQIILNWHNKLLDYLLDQRKQNPTLKFKLRQRDKNSRLSDGYWFQGNDKYIFLSFWARSGGSNMTPSMGFLLFVDDDGNISTGMEVVYNEEQDKEIIALYKKIIARYKLEKQHDTKYKCSFSEPDPFKSFNHFLTVIKPDIDQMFHKAGKEEIFISDEDFKKAVDKVLAIRGTPERDESEKDFLNVLSKYSSEQSTFYFNTLDKILVHLNVTGPDKRITFSCKSNQLSFIIGHRYGFILLKEEGNTLYGTMTSKPFGSSAVPFGKGSQLFYSKLTTPEVTQHLQDAQAACASQLNRIDQSRDAANNSPYFEKAVFDKAYRNKILNIPVVMKAAIRDLNQILFGPPGTGKTFNSVNYALSIIEGKGHTTIANEDRANTKKRFDQYIQSGQIVFTTFHQSMSYEDFIEGIKPKTDIDHSISYHIENGIFKRAVARAAYHCYQEYIHTKTKEVDYSFDDLYDAFIAHTREQIKAGTQSVLKTLRGRDVEIKEINSNDSIIARAKDSIAKSSAPLTKENIQKLYDTFKTGDEITDLAQVRDAVQVNTRITEFFAVFKGFKEFEKDFAKEYKGDEETQVNRSTDMIDSTEIQKKFEAGVFNDAVKNFSHIAKPVVLIIDEINRGNVSQIFGELITLIEEDKRLGSKEALEIVLPYSKSVFSVPRNLYIIGTMNTADRSIEALDTALRRRFSFTEMPALPKLIADYGVSKGAIDDIDLVEMLSTINNRIEKLVDKDHKIGHAYFMEASSEAELIDVFRNKLIPLLQEYFFGDYGKIGLVLGNSFVEKTNSSFAFAKFDGYATEVVDDLSDRSVYQIKDSTEWDFISIYE